MMVAVSISRSGVSITPKRVLAGDVTLLMTNATNEARRLTVRSAGGDLTRSGQLAVERPAQLRLHLAPGRYTMGVSGTQLQPITLAVSADAR